MPPWLRDFSVANARALIPGPCRLRRAPCVFPSLIFLGCTTRPFLPLHGLPLIESGFPSGAGREPGKKVFHLDTKMPIRRQICHSREEKHEAMHHQSGRRLLHSPVPQHLRRCGRRDGPVSIRYKNQRPTRLDSGKMGIRSQTGSRQYACRRPGVARQCRLTLPKVS